MMTTAQERCELLQAELDRCRALVRMLGAHDFSALEEGIRQLADFDHPLRIEFELTCADVQRAIARIESTVNRLHHDKNYRATLPFEVEIMKIALSMLAARSNLDPLPLLSQIEAQFLQAMQHIKEKH